MQRTLINLIVELGSLLAFSLMVVTGLILELILPPGSGRIEMLGVGRRHQTIAVYMDLSRHEWGNIHFTISLIFLALLLTHLLLHWKWILATAWGSAQKPQSWIRRMAIIASLVLIITPLILCSVGEKEIKTKAEFEAMREISEQNK